MKNPPQDVGLVWVFHDVLFFIVGLPKVCSSSLSWGATRVTGLRSLGQVLSQIGGDTLLVPLCPGAVPVLVSHLSLPRSTRRSWRTWRTLIISLTSATPSSCTAAARRTPVMIPRSWASSRCGGRSSYLYLGTHCWVEGLAAEWDDASWLFLDRTSVRNGPSKQTAEPSMNNLPMQVWLLHSPTASALHASNAAWAGPPSWSKNPPGARNWMKAMEHLLPPEWWWEHVWALRVSPRWSSELSLWRSLAGAEERCIPCVF